jgi:hypothetical protein
MQRLLFFNMWITLTLGCLTNSACNLFKLQYPTFQHIDDCNVNVQNVPHCLIFCKSECDAYTKFGGDLVRDYYIKPKQQLSEPIVLSTLPTKSCDDLSIDARSTFS